jgi:hypothetical protein
MSECRFWPSPLAARQENVMIDIFKRTDEIFKKMDDLFNKMDAKETIIITKKEKDLQYKIDSLERELELQKKLNEIYKDHKPNMVHEWQHHRERALRIVARSKIAKTIVELIQMADEVGEYVLRGNSTKEPNGDEWERVFDNEKDKWIWRKIED